MFDSKHNFYGKAAPGYYNRDNSETEIREPVKKKDVFSTFYLKVFFRKFSTFFSVGGGGGHP